MVFKDNDLCVEMYCLCGFENGLRSLSFSIRGITTCLCLQGFRVVTCNKVHQDRVLEYLEKVDKCNIWLKGIKVAIELMDRYDRVPQILLQDC
ncbi:unnamed protein product [Trifolium pratense]|uniref:Uncharacterized protein n=1 Tax=Trifolium pratense TaxID=57577 RepID=A0ACB0JYB8_TRIPR|nr:unnamed protein product [Trifolium pratense]